MSPFGGFPEGKTALTPIPAPFFSELLPEIDHLGELKVVLYTLWRLNQMEGAFRCLRESDFAADPRLMQGLSAGEAAHPALVDALARAVRRGVLLAARPPAGGEAETFYFLNSPKGRAGAQALERGQWRPEEIGWAPGLGQEPPNIYRLYEENFGPLTPLIADALRDAEANFPAAWIGEAIRIAVENNKRSWRYVSAILERWQREGRNERQNRQDRQDTEKDRRRYIEGEFSDFIEH